MSMPMPFNETTWREQIKSSLQKKMSGIRSAGVNSLYGFLSGMTLWPLVQASQGGDGLGVGLALAGVAGNIGANLVANQLQKLADETEAPQQLLADMQNDPQLQESIDTILEKLQVMELAAGTVAAEDRKWFRDTLKKELDKHRAAKTLREQVNRIQITGDVKDSVVVAGKKNKVKVSKKAVLAQTYIEKQIVQTTQSESPSKEEREAKKNRRHYLAQLRKHCQTLPLSALGEERSTGAELTLDKVYIDLDTTAKMEPLEAGNEKSAKTRPAGPEGQAVPVKLWDAVRDKPRVVVLGDPGAGKSTFIRQLCIQVAVAELENEAHLQGYAGNQLPVMLNLRYLAPLLNPEDLEECSASQKKSTLITAVKQVIRHTLSELDCLQFEAQLLEAIAHGGCLLILDGLDEVPFKKRSCIHQTVKVLLSEWQPQKTIITCRIRSYGDSSKFEDFAEYTVAPFSKEQIRSFISGWYDVQALLNRISPLDKQIKVDELIEAALDGPLQEISDNPMLLTTMTIIHQRDIGLPDHRVELYKLAVDVLLRRWRQHQAGRMLQISAALRAFLKDSRRLLSAVEELAYLAHAAMQNDTQLADIERGKALVVLERKAYLGEPALASEFLDYIDQHSGLLTGRGGEQGKPATYGFPHRTFQEYLAGCYLMQGRDLARRLKPLAKEGDYWATAIQLGFEELFYNWRQENTLLDLAYNFCRQSQAEGVSRERLQLWSSNIAVLLGTELIQRDQQEEDGGENYLLRLKKGLLQRLSGALPPVERAQAGRNLSVLGDSRSGVTGLAEMEFCYVPPGPFCMGAAKQDDEAYGWEKPLHTDKSITTGYWLGRYPVTRAQLQKFVDAGGYMQEEYWPEAQATSHWTPEGFKGTFPKWNEEKREWELVAEEHSRRAPAYEGARFNYANQPLVGISWYEALAYCRWLTECWRKEGLLNAQEEVRLPTEAEWEKAARGGSRIPEAALIVSLDSLAGRSSEKPKLIDNPFPERRYPWGEGMPEENRMNYRDSGIEATSAVGCFPQGASPHGCEEMSGNVWEWCLSKGRENYKEKSDEKVDASGAGRVIRGGGWSYDARDCRVSARGSYGPADRNFGFGFRLLRTKE